MNNIHNSLDKIDSIQGNNHILNKEQAEAVTKEWQNINSNLSNIRGTISDSNKTAEELWYCSDRLSTQVFAAVEVSLMVEAMLLKVVLMELTESCT